MPLLQPAEAGGAAAGLPGVAGVLQGAQAALHSLALRPQPACSAEQRFRLLYTLASDAFFLKSWLASQPTGSQHLLSEVL